MSKVADAIARWLDDHGLSRGDLGAVDRLEAIETTIGGPLPRDLYALYSRFGPGCEQLFSPVVHAGVVNSWPVWTPERSLRRLQRIDDPLWQLSPSVDIWLDTNEVTVLREDDVDESYSCFDDYWRVRLQELEAASFDPMTGLWLHPAMHAQRVDAPEELRRFLLDELFAGREVHVPGVGRFSPTPPPKSGSSFDLNRQGPPPSLHPEGLDRCEPVDLDCTALAKRWGHQVDRVRRMIEALHHDLDDALEHGPVDLMGLFRLHPTHHEARVLNNADQPIEVPAHRQVTARVSLEIARQFADARS